MNNLMENRSHTSRYKLNQESAQREEKRLFYAADYNAALAPDYEPNIPEREPRRETAPRKRPVVLPQLDPGKKRRKKLRAAMVIGVVFLTACACAVCMRNAQIFQNNVDIQSIGKQINSTTMELNAAKKELASIVDMEAYMQIAKEEYGMDFPAAEQLQQIEVEAMPTEEETLMEIQKSGNLIDSVLDWLNSLGRRK